MIRSWEMLAEDFSCDRVFLSSCGIGRYRPRPSSRQTSLSLSTWPTRDITDLESALASVDQVMASGPSVVLVTALREHDAAGDRIEMLAVDSAGAFMIETPLLPVNVNGAGDMTAALFFAHWRKSGSVQIALELTTAAVFAVLEATADAGAREIELIKAQELIANPVPPIWGRASPITVPNASGIAQMVKQPPREPDQRR